MKGGFVERLREGTWLGHVAEHVALQLQQEAGHDQRRGKTRAVKGSPGRLQRHLRLRRRGRRPRRRPARGAPRQPPRAGGGGLRLRRGARAVPTPGRAHGVRAVDRGDPRGGGQPRHPLHPAQQRQSLVQLGQGVHAQRIRATMTSKTGALAVDIAGDKDLTTTLLASAGLPVPKQETVRTADGAVAAARRIGFPVVVKPLDGNHGRGVCLDLQTDGRGARRPSPWPRTSPAAGTSSSSRWSPAATTAASSSAAGCRPSPSGCRPTSSATAPTPSAELVDITNADPRRGVGPREGADPDQGRRRRRWSCVQRAGLRRSTTCRPPTRWSSWPSPATCRPVASRSTAPSTPTPTTSRSPRRPPG